MSVVTRFAPSLTGYIHVGNLRTAIFAWLFARHHQGKFIVRIEDTDKERSTPDAIRTILDGLEWMDLRSDEPIALQSRRIARHLDVANQLLRSGHAYKDWTTSEEMEALRQAHKDSGVKGPFRYHSPYRDLPLAENTNDAQPFVVRFKSPQEGSTTIQDLVQGDVTVSNNELDDFVILRADSTPTHILAAVVDDHDSQVTHVIHGDDHLNNTFRQLPIYRALDWSNPTYAHLPMILGEDGRKLSKRNGSPGLDGYQARGILPEALFNYLVRMGWGTGDDLIITRKQAIKWFDLKDVNRSPARVNEKRLLNLSGHYIREADDDRLTGLLSSSYFIGLQLKPALSVLKARASNLIELKESTEFIFACRPIKIDDDVRSELDVEIIRDLYGLLFGSLWEREPLESIVKGYSLTKEISMKQIAGTIRAALTGKKSSPSTMDLLLILGKTEALKRLWDQIPVVLRVDLEKIR